MSIGRALVLLAYLRDMSGKGSEYDRVVLAKPWCGLVHNLNIGLYDYLIPPKKRVRK